MMIAYDNDWHDRMAYAADAIAKDRTIVKRLDFYTRRLMAATKQNDPGCPRENIMGILMNVLNYTKEMAEQHIENELIIRTRRNEKA